MWYVEKIKHYRFILPLVILVSLWFSQRWYLTYDHVSLGITLVISYVYILMYGLILILNNNKLQLVEKLLFCILLLFFNIIGLLIYKALIK